MSYPHREDVSERKGEFGGESFPATVRERVVAKLETFFNRDDVVYGDGELVRVADETSAPRLNYGFDIIELPERPE